MGGKLLWTGLTLIVAFAKLNGGLPIDLVGSIIMIIGLIAFILDK